MPHRKKKKFIDKKNAVSFRLVHRSQKDPLQASEDVGQRVLLPVVDKDVVKRKEEERKFGVFYDDDYDYLKHLKDVSETLELEPVDTFKLSASHDEQVQTDGKPENKMQLPSTVFASAVETEVGLLNKAAPISGPRLDWDPDIVAALDDDFDYDDPENILHDDFIVQANATEGQGADRDENWTDDDEDDIDSNGGQFSDADMDDQLGERMFEQEETKSRFTAYSMTSSVIRRTEGLTLLDDRFEKMYEEYDESEIGALDHEDIDGRVDPSSKILDSVLEEFEEEQKKVHLSDMLEPSTDTKSSECKNVNENEEEEDSEDDTDLVRMVIDDPKEKWDCESILSTYSNLYNHPKLITEPKNVNSKKIELTSRLGIPMDGLERPGLTRKQIEKELRESQRADRATTYRPRGETLEEKKQRKQAIKEERKERRLEKKTNKMAFSEEKKRQETEHLNLKNNLQGVKML